MKRIVTSKKAITEDGRKGFEYILNGKTTWRILESIYFDGSYVIFHMNMRTGFGDRRGDKYKTLEEAEKDLLTVFGF